MTETDWTKEQSDKAHALVKRAAQEILELGMTTPAAPWRVMLIDAIEHLAKELTPAQLLVDIGKTRRWLDLLEAEANGR